MSFRSKTPGEGGQVRAFHNTHLKTRNGEKWYAHIAGPILWLECHTKGYSKPCLHWITRGELVCKRCHPLDPKEDLGYIPIYRERDGKPGFCVVKDYARDIVDKIALHARIVIQRGEEKSDGLSVNPSTDGRRYHSTRADFMQSVDLTPSLLRVFAMPELTQWYYRTQLGREPPAELPKGTAVNDKGEPFSPTMQGAAKRWGAEVILDAIGRGGESLSNDEFAAQVKSNGKHSANGKPKPKD